MSKSNSRSSSRSNSRSISEPRQVTALPSPVLTCSAGEVHGLIITIVIMIMITIKLIISIILLMIIILLFGAHLLAGEAHSAAICRPGDIYIYIYIHIVLCYVIL